MDDNSPSPPVVTPRSRKQLPLLQILHEVNFRLYLGGLGFTWVAVLMEVTARGWLMRTLTDSPFLVSLVTALHFLPMLLLSLFGGILADRVSRKAIVVIAEMGIVISYALLALLFFLDVLEPWHLLLLALMSGSGVSISLPARFAIIPALVGPKLLGTATAMGTSMWSGAMLVGPAIAGFLIGSVGMGNTLVITALLGVPPVVLYWMMRFKEEAHPVTPPHTSMLRNLGEGFGYVRRNRGVLGLIIAGGVGSIFALPYQALLPVFARDILHTGSEGFGLLMAGAGIGSLVGVAAIALMSGRYPLLPVFMVSAAVFGLLVAGFSASTVFLLSMGLMVLVGVAQQLFMTSNFALIQMTVPGYILGRVLGIRYLAFGFVPVGQMGVGALAELLGTRVSVGGAGILGTFILLLILLAIPELRERKGSLFWAGIERPVKA